LPLTNGYEFLIAFAWGIVLLYLWFEYRYRLKTVGLFVLPVVWLLLAYIAEEMPVDQRTITPLMPALKSSWLSVHVATAILSYGAFALSFGLAVMYLLKERYADRDTRVENLFDHLPAMELLDELCYKFITFGFFLLTMVIISGAIWAEQAWGSYWSWDPKETWSLITWLIYGACLHARKTYGWQGRRSLIIAIIGFAAVLFTFFGVNYLLVGLHSYA
jgi:cytochrome c-type biogenesis protein CcsB